MTYDEFYTMLKKMKAAGGVDYVISAPGFYSKEASLYKLSSWNSIRMHSLHSTMIRQGKYRWFSAKENEGCSFRESRTLLRMDFINKESAQRQQLQHVTTSSHQMLRQNQVYLHTGLDSGLKL